MEPESTLVGVVEQKNRQSHPWVDLLHPSPLCKLVIGPSLALNFRPESTLVGVTAGGGRSNMVIPTESPMGQLVTPLSPMQAGHWSKFGPEL